MAHGRKRQPVWLEHEVGGAGVATGVQGQLPLGPGEQFGFGPPDNGQGARSWSSCKFLDGEGRFKTPLRPREGQDPHTARTAPPPPSLLPSRVGSREIDELESRFVLSLAQLLAASWVTQAHQYQREYSLECGPIRSYTAGQSSVHGGLSSGSQMREGGWGGGGVVIPCLLQDLPPALPSEKGSKQESQQLDTWSGRQRGAA